MHEKCNNRHISFTNFPHETLWHPKLVVSGFALKMRVTSTESWKRASIGIAWSLPKNFSIFPSPFHSFSWQLFVVYFTVGQCVPFAKLNNIHVPPSPSSVYLFRRFGTDGTFRPAAKLELFTSPSSLKAALDSPFRTCLSLPDLKAK